MWPVPYTLDSTMYSTGWLHPDCSPGHHGAFRWVNWKAARDDCCSHTKGIDSVTQRRRWQTSKYCSLAKCSFLVFISPSHSMSTKNIFQKTCFTTGIHFWLDPFVFNVPVLITHFSSFSRLMERPNQHNFWIATFIPTFLVWLVYWRENPSGWYSVEVVREEQLTLAWFKRFRYMLNLLVRVMAHFDILTLQ